MSNIRQAVVELLAAERGIDRERVTGTSRLQLDLGMDGDDAVDFFASIERRFGTDLSRLYERWDKHFGPEGLPPAAMVISGFSTAFGALAAAWADLSGFWTFLAVGGSGAIGWWCFSLLKPTIAITVDEVVAAVSKGAWHA